MFIFLFHELSLAFAMMAMQSDVDVKTLFSMLGHYSARYTLDTYTHVNNQMPYGAAQKIGSSMNESTGNTPEPKPPTTPP